MGAVASAITNALDHSKEDEAKAKEQLELMMKLADARLDTFESELRTMFLDRESTMKTSVPGKRALRFERHVQVDTETTVCDAFRRLGDSLLPRAESLPSPRRGLYPGQQRRYLHISQQ